MNVTVHFINTYLIGSRGPGGCRPVAGSVCGVGMRRSARVKGWVWNEQL